MEPDRQSLEYRMRRETENHRVDSAWALTMIENVGCVVRMAMTLIINYEFTNFSEIQLLLSFTRKLLNFADSH